ncbi:winged helix-turn-helix domain-containing protein [Micromonospora sp. WMMD964]|uniref:winged helix-turn-helix domain-containing protein n=1 Tax=Micromonospora sp. WMMD964 TaxID=3016091 RepID=UPI00249B14C5|nr:winged helix-turn-helix domain-containing protein [Micromonospora sp. WMMD964]WFF04277.1 winged helix-turn-helix domain-containing protein [Micromonospora sp. WMMD964]
MSVRERMVRRLDGLGTLVICTDLAELQAMIGPPRIGGPTPLVNPAAGSAAAPAPAVAPAPPAVPDPASGRITLGDLEIDALDHLVTWRGQPLALTRLEHRLLTHLATAPVGVWTYERLFESVWGGAYLGDSSVLHSAVKRLRRKLRTADATLGIQTVRGIGYRLSVT